MVLAENGRICPARGFWMGKQVYCTACGAECQMLPSGWRCPWATASSRATAWVGGDLVLVCDRPYERTRESLVIVRDTRTVQA